MHHFHCSAMQGQRQAVKGKYMKTKNGIFSCMQDARFALEYGAYGGKVSGLGDKGMACVS